MTQLPDFGEPLANDYYRRGYAAGLRDGEKRLARAIRRYIKVRRVQVYGCTGGDIEKWLSARIKRGKK